ncbi:MAG: enoyl-CoA hydratase/isomerase family protein [Syntrophobacteraceae bacterium]|jgi:2-(1,2-epoxy-1,2-dihydrophenyl)acetyl-CoA isomerase
MATQKSLTTDNDLFSSSLENDVLVIRQKQHIRHVTQDINDIFSFYDYLDLMLSSKSYKVLVMFARPEQREHLEHSRFLCKVLSTDWENTHMYRLINVVNRFILTLSRLNYMTVYAGQGKVSLFHLNLSLAYDYRLVADDTVFENLNAGIGLITKGSGYFLPRVLGIRKATEVLQWMSFSAEDALQLGLVDRIVPAPKLEEETMQFVRANLADSASTLLGIRKLLKCDIKELKRSLELEDQLIKERLRSGEFRQTFAANCKKTFGFDIETLHNGR